MRVAFSLGVMSRADVIGGFRLRRRERRMGSIRRRRRRRKLNREHHICTVGFSASSLRKGANRWVLDVPDADGIAAMSDAVSPVPFSSPRPG